ncbi:7-alpha-hydroxycholest-4-en-3-one 12-alpha-hydroxylase [Fusarium longipes]|uniref:7-alpha-hydroxycholest-4-en-3-one 12-alpha-hydroxylase n=1 Tax=Fusarium longipes TaxID=694270 RepID=A0A395T7T2_9HYPO|nr:7-alpha-hydroxycholest-4-en-3-one 12-alpha-hydroxylase [Fusarium longipes]
MNATTLGSANPGSSVDISSYGLYLLLFILPFFTTYVFTAIGNKGYQDATTVREPPRVPYWIPFVGNTIGFAYNTERFLFSILSKFGKVPLRIFVGAEQMYFIPHGQAIIELFKSSRYTTTKTFGVMTVRDAFGLPEPDVAIYAGDDSGVDVKPASGWEHVEQEKRFHFVQHRQLHSLLAGTALDAMINKYVEAFSKHIAEDTTFPEHEWVEVDDLYDWFKNCLLRATVEALCGEEFLKLSPDFPEVFWSFDYHLPNLFRRLPRFIIPKSYQARDRLQDSMFRFHQYGQQNLDFTDTNMLEKDWTPEFGSRLMTTRQKMFKNIGISPRGGAALDVGLIWAVNANAIPAAMWMLLDILLDKNLTDRIIAEIEPSFHEKSLSFDADRLYSGPLLNSVYLEVLRVRVAAPVGRSSLIPNLKLGKWPIKQGVNMLSTSWYGGRDPDFWNTGSTLPDGSDEHPVNSFWAERFLKYDDDPASGPVRRTEIKTAPRNTKRTPEDDKNARVVTEGTQGYFYPYGGGTKMCPGRFFSKQQLMSGVAVALRAYEIELINPEAAAKVGPNMDYFPFGTIPPKGKVPARIRRRRL